MRMISHPTSQLVSLVTLLLLFACNQPAENAEDTNAQKGDLADFNLNGSVQSLHIREFRVTDSAGVVQVIDTVGNRKITFDTSGRVTEAVFINSEGEVGMRMVNKYDPEGFKIEEIRESMLWEGEYDQMERTVYEKGENGKRSGYKQFIDMKPLEIENRLRLSGTYSYDAEDRLLEESVFNSEGELVKKMVERYASNGHRLSAESRYREGQVVEVFERAYDEKDQFIRYSQYDSAGTLVDYDEYSWNEQGNISQRISERDGEWRRIVFNDDHRGETIERLDFDSLGTQLQRTTYNRQYDDQDNLIRTERLVDGVVIGIEAREIRYY